MKEKINVFEYSREILEALNKGILITSKYEDKVNTMTISWGALGIEWSKPMFTIYVREHRFTKSLLDKNPEFTVNVPLGDYDKKIVGLAGVKSGRDMDKIKELGLTLEEPETISVPGIKEFPLTLECRVVYKQQQKSEMLLPEYNEKFYPQDVDGLFHGANKDYHVM